MTRYRWLALGLVSAVAVTATVVSQRRPARIAVDTVRSIIKTRVIRHLPVAPDT